MKSLFFTLATVLVATYGNESMPSLRSDSFQAAAEDFAAPTTESASVPSAPQQFFGFPIPFFGALGSITDQVSTLATNPVSTVQNLTSPAINSIGSIPASLTNFTLPQFPSFIPQLPFANITDSNGNLQFPNILSGIQQPFNFALPVLTPVIKSPILLSAAEASSRESIQAAEVDDVQAAYVYPPDLNLPAPVTSFDIGGGVEDINFNVGNLFGIHDTGGNFNASIGTDANSNLIATLDGGASLILDSIVTGDQGGAVAGGVGTFIGPDGFIASFGGNGTLVGALHNIIRPILDSAGIPPGQEILFRIGATRTDGIIFEPGFPLPSFDTLGGNVRVPVVSDLFNTLSGAVPARTSTATVPNVSSVVTPVTSTLGNLTSTLLAQEDAAQKARRLRA